MRGFDVGTLAHFGRVERLAVVDYRLCGDCGAYGGRMNFVMLERIAEGHTEAAALVAALEAAPKVAP